MFAITDIVVWKGIICTYGAIKPFVKTSFDVRQPYKNELEDYYRVNKRR